MDSYDYDYCNSSYILLTKHQFSVHLEGNTGRLPFLSKVYLNGVINSIVRTQIECQLGFTRVNIIAYTNDFVILADSVKNLIICYISFIIQ